LSRNPEKEGPNSNRLLRQHLLALQLHNGMMRHEVFLDKRGADRSERFHVTKLLLFEDKISVSRSKAYRRPRAMWRNSPKLAKFGLTSRVCFFGCHRHMPIVQFYSRILLNSSLRSALVGDKARKVVAHFSPCGISLPTIHPNTVPCIGGSYLFINF
jgi:hypothetical protein